MAAERTERDVGRAATSGVDGASGQVSRNTAWRGLAHSAVVVSDRTPDPCGHAHGLSERMPGDRQADWPGSNPGGPRLWRVAGPVEARRSEHGPDEPAEMVQVPPGTTLRYDQHDELHPGDPMFDRQWDRFAVLDGPLAGQCLEFEPTFARVLVRPVGGTLPDGPFHHPPDRDEGDQPAPRLGRVLRRRFHGFGPARARAVEANGASLYWIEWGFTPPRGWTVGERVEWHEDFDHAYRYIPLKTDFDGAQFWGVPRRILRVVDAEARGHCETAIYYTAFTVAEEIPLWQVYGPHGQAVEAVLGAIDRLTIEAIDRAPLSLDAIPASAWASGGTRVAVTQAAHHWRVRARATDWAAMDGAVGRDGDVEDLDDRWWRWARARHAAMLAVVATTAPGTDDRHKQWLRDWALITRSPMGDDLPQPSIDDAPTSRQADAAGPVDVDRHAAGPL